MTAAPSSLRICLLFCVALAFALRVGVALDHPPIQRPDEIFETLEPAHRLWSGWGVVTWEWREGIRSWLFPGFLAGLMALANALGLGGEDYLIVIAVVLSLASLGVVAVAAVLGWRSFGLSGAWLCGILCAIWPDLVYFAPKTLTEVQAGNLLAVAAALADLHPRGGATARPFTRSAIVGLLLGIVFCLRFQLAPAELIVAAWVGWRNGRAGWWGLLAGAAAPLLALGLCDALAWGSPFQSIWKNFYVNWVERRSMRYGLFPWYWYFWEIVRLSGGAILPAAVLFLVGLPVAPGLALVAIATVLSHTPIGHKEISFIYAAIPAGVIVTGLGTARALALLSARRPDLPARGVLITATGLWIAIIATNVHAASETSWNAVSRELMPLWRKAGRQPDLCGLALVGPAFPWYDTGGYATLNRAVPLYWPRTPNEFAVARPGFNYFIVPRNDAGTAAGDEPVRCTDTFCLLRRNQSCAPVHDLGINAVLARAGD